MLADNEIGHPAVNTTDFNAAAAFSAEVFYTCALCFVVLNTACAKVSCQPKLRLSKPEAHNNRLLE